MKTSMAWWPATAAIPLPAFTRRCSGMWKNWKFCSPLPASLEILQPFTSIGLQVWAIVSCTLVNALKKRRELLLGIPLVVLAAGLWIGTPVYAEFRYAYPFFLAAPFLIAVTVWEKK